jgi:hypothetical protein
MLKSCLHWLVSVYFLIPRTWSSLYPVNCTWGGGGGGGSTCEVECQCCQLLSLFSFRPNLPKKSTTGEKFGGRAKLQTNLNKTVYKKFVHSDLLEKSQPRFGHSFVRSLTNFWRFLLSLCGRTCGQLATPMPAAPIQQMLKDTTPGMSLSTQTGSEEKRFRNKEV